MLEILSSLCITEEDIRGGARLVLGLLLGDRKTSCFGNLKTVWRMNGATEFAISIGYGG